MGTFNPFFLGPPEVGCRRCMCYFDMGKKVEKGIGYMPGHNNGLGPCDSKRGCGGCSGQAKLTRKFVSHGCFH